MRYYTNHLMIALLIAAAIAAGGCGTGAGSSANQNQNVGVDPNPVIPPNDPNQEKLNSGKLVTGTPKEDCDNSFVLDAVNELCEIFKLASDDPSKEACINQTSSCNDYGRQIYTGSVLGPGQKGPVFSQWNARGGSGALMADAAVCTLRELSPKVSGGGPLLSEASLNIGIGDVKVRQEVGYLDFDRIYGKFKGYRKLRIELPVVGKFDAVTQNIEVGRVFYPTGSLYNEIPKAGDYPLLSAYGLNLSTEEKNKSIDINPGSFDVTTPIGIFEVSPHFEYQSNTVVADTPFGTESTYIFLPNDAWDNSPAAIKLYDLYGLFPGINNNAAPLPGTIDYKALRTGWTSQIGFGSRGTLDDDLWTPPSSGFFSRPDYDPTGLLKFQSYESRSTEENLPSVYAAASAAIKYPDDPSEMLPGWVVGLPGLDWDAYIQVTPTIKAGATGQFGLVVSEGTDNNHDSKEFGAHPESRTSALGIYSGSEVNASFEVLAELKLYVSADFGWPIDRIDLININPKFPIPIAGGTPSSSNVELAAAYSTSDNTPDLPETLDHFNTFKGTKKPVEFINLCYAKETEVPPEKPPCTKEEGKDLPPECKTEKGDVTELFEYLPCNICLYTDAVINSKTGEIKEPVHQEILSPVNPTPPAVWHCDAKVKSGCMDLCKLNKETGVFSVVKNPSQIADSIPTSDPDYNELYPFYKACMISCEGVTSPISFGNITACKGLDPTPPAFYGLLATGGGGGGAPAPVPVNTNIAVPFSEPMDPASINTSTFTVSDAYGNAVAGNVSYDAATYSAIFTPSGRLEYDRTYTATITTGVRDTAGNSLAADFTWSFTTEVYVDTAPPDVTGTTPAADATGVPIDTTVSATFSEPLDPATVISSTFVLSSGRAGSVAGTTFLTDGGNTAGFMPSAALNSGDTYTATITMGVKDLAGNALTSDFSWNFTTLSAPPAPEERTAFVTSVQGNGNLSTWADAIAGGNTGLAAGDAICQARATAAGLSGTFVAWLSDFNNDAYCRVHNLAGKKSANCGQGSLPVAAGPWVRTDGFPFSETIDSLVNDGKVYAPVMYDEFGSALPRYENYMTGTQADGSYDTSGNISCYDWTSNTSNPSVHAVGGWTGGTTYSWTHNYSGTCNSSSWRLLCLETGDGLPLPPFTTAGKKVFVTSTSGTGNLETWAGSGGNRGVAGGDAICQAKATEAGLTNPANFKAWLSDNTTAAKDHLTSNGPWVRLDGVKVADSKADLIDGAIFTAISQTETGAYLSTTTWTGTYSNGTLDSITSTCEGWTTTTPTNNWNATLGESSLTDANWTKTGYNPCSTLRHLYCFED